MRTLLKCCVLLGLGLSSAGCFSFRWQREIQNLPLLERARAELPVSGIGLDRCLEILGAPTLVFEHEVHGLQLVYAWDQTGQKDLSVSVPAGDTSSASFSYANIKQKQEGVVLWLDSDWQLVEWKHGYLRSLIGAEPRPATLEQLERAPR